MLCKFPSHISTLQGRCQARALNTYSESPLRCRHLKTLSCMISHHRRNPDRARWAVTTTQRSVPQAKSTTYFSICAHCGISISPRWRRGRARVASDLRRTRVPGAGAQGGTDYPHVTARRSSRRTRSYSSCSTERRRRRRSSRGCSPGSRSSARAR